MLKHAPEDQLLASLIALLRTGLPPALDGEEWTGDACPAGHWLMPAGARLYRYDDEATIETPCAIFYFDKDSEAYDAKALGGDELWWCHVGVDLLWGRDLNSLETQQLRHCLLNVFTANMVDPVPSGQRLATARLSAPEGEGIPGIQVMALHSPVCTVQKGNSGHPEFNLTFTVLCAGIPPLPVPVVTTVADQEEEVTLSAEEYTDISDEIIFEQTTEGITINLAAPTSGSATITITNNGTAAFTLGPQGALPEAPPLIPSGYSGDFVWNSENQGWDPVP